jgi:hypothetical protein
VPERPHSSLKEVQMFRRCYSFIVIHESMRRTELEAKKFKDPFSVGILIENGGNIVHLLETFNKEDQSKAFNNRALLTEITSGLSSFKERDLSEVSFFGRTAVIGHPRENIVVAVACDTGNDGTDRYYAKGVAQSILRDFFK